MNENNSSPKISLVNIDMEWASKLIDVISKGVGALSAKFVAKQVTEGKRYEIEKIAKAVADANKLPVKVSYLNGNLTVEPKDETLNPIDLPEYRAAEYVIRKESLKLSSIEKASLFAAEELKKKHEKGETISDEKVNESWISKYFDEVGNIREEKVLKYWGKLLAGEIQNPGSFSMRTLNLLGNITSDEAELITKALNHSVLVVFPEVKDFKNKDNFGFIFHNARTDPDKNKFFTHYEIESLISFGITTASDSTIVLIEKGHKKNIFYSGDFALKISRSKIITGSEQIRSGKVKLLTKLGLELLELYKSNTQEEYLNSVLSTIFDKNLDVALAKGIKFEDGKIQISKVISQKIHN